MIASVCATKQEKAATWQMIPQIKAGQKFSGWVFLGVSRPQSLHGDSSQNGDTDAGKGISKWEQDGLKCPRASAPWGTSPEPVSCSRQGHHQISRPSWAPLPCTVIPCLSSLVSKAFVEHGTVLTDRAGKLSLLRNNLKSSWEPCLSGIWETSGGQNSEIWVLENKKAAYFPYHLI